MDHFARPDDELAVAQREGVLHRNFQGLHHSGRYRSAGDGRFRHQHDWRLLRAEQKELKQYYQQVDEQGNALWRGIALTRDDCIRRDVIKSLICNFVWITPLLRNSGICTSLILCGRSQAARPVSKRWAGGCG